MDPVCPYGCTSLQNSNCFSSPISFLPFNFCSPKIMVLGKGELFFNCVIFLLYNSFYEKKNACSSLLECQMKMIQIHIKNKMFENL